MIEAGFPAASPGDFEAVQRIARETKGGIAVAALARCRDGDPQRAVEAIRVAERPHLHVFIATSDIHLKHKLRIGRDEALERGRRVGPLRPRELGADAEIEFSAEDASGPTSTTCSKVYEAVVDAGASTVNIPDTVGYAIPAEFGALVGRVVDRVGRDATVSVHCHNDLGLATANTLAAVQAGARQVEVTINGLGERAGNASLEEVVMALRTRPTQFPELGSRGPDRADHRRQPAGQLPHGVRHPAEQGDRRRQRVRPRVGDPPGRRDQEPADLRDHDAAVGRAGRQPADDRQAVRPAGAPGQAPRARPRPRGRRARRGLPPGDRPGRRQEGGHRRGPPGARRAARSSEVPASVALEGWSVTSSHGGNATGTVSLSVDGEDRAAESTGNGPVNALFSAVDKAIQPVLGWQPVLTEYEIKAVSAGEDAQGQVLVRCRRSSDEGPGALVVSGHGLSTNIIEASLEAYLVAINKLHGAEINGVAVAFVAPRRRAKSCLT